MASKLLEKMRQVEALKNDGGIQGLLNGAYEILDNPIVMFDTDYSLISFTENVVTDDPVWEEIIKSGSFSPAMQELFKEEGFIDAVANAETVTLLISDKLKYDRMSGKVFNNRNVHVANLVIVASSRAFEPGDSILFEAVCKVFSDEIGSDTFFYNYGKSYEETLIRKLLDGNIADKELYSAHIAILYGGLKENLFLAVVDTSQHNPELSNLPHLRDLLMQLEPACKYAIYLNYIVMILSSEHEALDVKTDLKKLARFFRQENIYAGISRRFGNLYKLRIYYDEAVSTLQNGLISDIGQRIYFHHGADQDS